MYMHSNRGVRVLFLLQATQREPSIQCVKSRIHGRLALIATRCPPTHLPTFERSLGDPLTIRISFDNFMNQKGFTQGSVSGIFPIRVPVPYELRTLRNPGGTNHELQQQPESCEYTPAWTPWTLTATSVHTNPGCAHPSSVLNVRLCALLSQGLWAVRLLAIVPAVLRFSPLSEWYPTLPVYLTKTLGSSLTLPVLISYFHSVSKSC